MAAITVTYNGSTILTTDADGIKTLKTSGKYCLDNIAVQFNPPSTSNKITELIDRTISTYTNDNVTMISAAAFMNCYSLTTVSFSECTTIGYSAFTFCSRLTSVSFPKCTTIRGYAFAWCGSRLTTVSFPKCTTISGHAFGSCSSLTTASFPKCTTISSYAFQKCVRLTSLYLTNSSVATLANSNALSSTPIDGYSTIAKTFGSIYVPASLLASYKAATNWTYFSSRFVGI